MGDFKATMREASDDGDMPDGCEDREPPRLPALAIVRDMLKKHKHHVAALEQMEKMLTAVRLEDGSPLEEMLWEMLRRSQLARGY